MEDCRSVTEGVHRLKGVFLEMPGARLTLVDASKLSGLDQSICELVLGTLEEARFLTRASDGRYQRRTDDSPQIMSAFDGYERL